MIALDTRIPSTLEWKKESLLGRKYELKGGDSTYATLELSKFSGSKGETKTATGDYAYARRGLFSSSVKAQVPGTKQETALYKPNWNSTRGKLILASGETLLFRSMGFFAQTWVLEGPDKTALLRFKSRGFVKHDCEVTIEPEGRKRSDLPMLLSFCWFILLQQAKSAAIAAG